MVVGSGSYLFQAANELVKLNWPKNLSTVYVPGKCKKAAFIRYQCLLRRLAQAKFGDFFFHQASFSGDLCIFLILFSFLQVTCL